MSSLGFSTCHTSGDSCHWPPDLYETKCLCDFYYGENKRTLGRPTFNQNDRIQSENDRIQILSDHNNTTCKKQQ